MYISILRFNNPIISHIISHPPIFSHNQIPTQIPYDSNTPIFFSPFQYIGTLDVPRPTSKIEIVAAMRRIRVSTDRVRELCWRELLKENYIKWILQKLEKFGQIIYLILFITYSITDNIYFNC